jgi:gliding motility-associated-like protein
VRYTFTPHIDPGDGGGECGDGVPVVITIEINPQPRVAVTADQVLCYDGDAEFDITNLNTVNTTGTWRYDVEIVYPTDVDGTYGTAGSTVTLTNQTATGVAALTDDLTNSGTDVQTVRYTFTPHIDPGDGGGECGDGVPVVITIEINPQPRVAVTTDQVLCYDGDAEFDITNLNTVNATGTWRYDVEIVYPTDVDGTYGTAGSTVTLTNQTATGVAALTDDLTNSGTDVQTVTYTFTPHIDPGDGGGECGDGVPVILTIEINPQPRVAVTADQVLCYDGDASFDITNLNIVNATGTWRYDVEIVYPTDVDGTYGTAGSTVTLTNQTATGVAVLTDDLTNSGTDVQTVRYIFTPHIDPGDGGGECGDGVPVVIPIEINPQPRLTIESITPDTLICYNEGVTIRVNTPNTTTGTIRYILTSQKTGDTDNINADGGIYDLGALDETDIINNTNHADSVIYTLTPYIENASPGLDCGDGVPSVFTIYINPEPVITVAVDDTVWCDSSNVEFLISDNNGFVFGDKVYELTHNAYDQVNVDGVQDGGEYLRTLNINDFLTNKDDIYKDIEYTFRARIKDTRPGHSGNYFDCDHGADTTITLHLNPTPRISDITLLKNILPELYCNDSTVSIVVTSPTIPYLTGELYYNLVTNHSPLVSGVEGDGDYLFSSGVATIVDALHNDDDSAVMDVVYMFDPWIRDTRLIQDCHHGGVDESVTVYVAATLVPTAIPDTVQYGGWNISCYGYADGQVELGVRGGFGPYPGGNYYYLWTTPDGSGLAASEEDQSGLTAGTYSVVVTDINSCRGGASVVLYQPDTLRVVTDTIIINPCAGISKGAIEISVFGGTIPYSYDWDGQGLEFSSQDIYNIPTGLYYLVVEDPNGCTNTPPIFRVGQGQPIGYGHDLNSFGDYEISCTGAADGWIVTTEVYGHGLIDQWDYYWTYPDTSIHAYTKDIDSLYAGIYSLKMTDTIGCEAIQTFVLTEPAPIRFASFDPSLYGGIYNISCRDSADGSISFVIDVTDRDNRTYTYAWSGPPEAALNPDPAATMQNNIPAGTYTVQVTDNYLCFSDTAVTLSEPDSILANPSQSSYNGYSINCYEANTGWIALKPSGGLGPYAYSWRTIPAGIPISDQDSVYGLTVGDYEVIVTDDLNCVRDWSFSLDQPLPVQTSETISLYNGYNISCSGGNDGEVLALNPTGGVGGYTYLWHRENDLSWTSDIETPSGLPADIYSVEVRDLNNCLFMDTLIFAEPDPLVIDSFMSLEITCNATNDGWAQVMVSGGIDHMPYTYLWNNLMTSTADTAGNLGIGWYNVLVTDANGCTTIDSVYIAEPLPVTGQFTILSTAWYNNEMISCAGAADGAVWVQASGGRHPYTYNWIGTTVNNDTIYELPAGTHQVRIEDAGGCDTVLSVVLTEPLALNAVGIIERNASCYNLNDGEINLEPRGGVGPYTYRWTSGSLPGELYTEDIENLYADEYYLTLWDMNSCRLDTSYIVTEPEPLRAEIITDTIPFCPDSYDGMIHVNVTGGTEPYDIWWVSQNTNDPVLYNLGEGTYTVQVDDQFNCGLAMDSVVLVSDQNNCLNIPTAISPNNDGKNDLWEIEGIEYYHDAIIEIYNRWGDLIFRSEKGYGNKFDGMYHGRPLPVDSYHFIINLNNGSEPILGNITIIL